jgi:CDP-diacylglycerol--glycerol-3-phosphate 3-phosphatidyltransferase|tara:strand:- start:2965 stop:3477 length:513 start_codon:yes stop_codon:yes gene_type:complete
MIPNIISFSRIFLIFPIIFFILIGEMYISLALFLLGCLTDYFDGLVSRIYNQESIFGANLDLLADKIFVCCLMIFLSFHFDNFILMISSLLIISRELSIGALRQYYFSINLIKKSKVNFIGKVKTFLQMISIGSAILFLETDFQIFIEIFILLTVFFSWLSFFNYIYAKD